jgi:tRNA nucleotidyltransferase/poly(A) polymerase
MKKIELHDSYRYPREELKLVHIGAALMSELTSMGYSAYIVGGCVRDLLMYVSPKDVDIATNMPIDVIKQHYKTIEYGGGEKHGTVIVHYKGEDFELTQFRSESTYSDNRRPDEVNFVDTFKEDTLRRDFTINAMGMNHEGEVTDYHGGLEDIENKVIRTVGDAEDRFGEDSLRILRAARFAARLGFKIDGVTLGAMESLGDTINNVSRERIRDEFEKSMQSNIKSFGIFVRYLDVLGIMHKLFDGYHSSVVDKICAATSSDKIINFALLFVNQSDTTELAKLKLTSSELKSISYCYYSYRLMYEHDTDDRIEAKVKVVLDENFCHLTQFYKAYYGVEMDMHMVCTYRRYAEVYDLNKYVNAYILSKKLTGTQFGQVISDYTPWVFEYYHRRLVLPLEIEWKQHIDDFINQYGTQLLWRINK